MSADEWRARQCIRELCRRDGAMILWLITQRPELRELILEEAEQAFMQVVDELREERSRATERRKEGEVS
jgi:hypothetical protein